MALGTAGCGGSVLDAYEESEATPSPAVTSPLAPPTVTEQPRPTRTRRPQRPPTPQSTPQSTPSVDVPELKVPPSFDRPVLGGDVSWPQCPKGMGIPQKPTLGLPMPLPSAEFVILGLTNGPGFTPNPCLADQVDWVRKRHLMAAAYAVNSFPDEQTLERYGDQGPFDGSTRLGALRNVGFQQAMFNLATMQAAGLTTPIIWLDVEPVPIFEWSADQEANAAVVVGAVRGYTDAGFQVGAYSTPLLWETVVGDFTLGGVPEWRAAGQTSMAEALERCREEWSFQGGPGVLGQWVEENRDRNVTCPGASKQMFRWFSQY
jgi:hypothetical protein